jgi:hypothetical protein
MSTFINHDGSRHPVKIDLPAHRSHNASVAPVEDGGKATTINFHGGVSAAQVVHGRGNPTAGIAPAGNPLAKPPVPKKIAATPADYHPSMRTRHNDRGAGALPGEGYVRHATGPKSFTPGMDHKSMAKAILEEAVLSGGKC